MALKIIFFMELGREPSCEKAHSREKPLKIKAPPLPPDKKSAQAIPTISSDDILVLRLRNIDYRKLISSVEESFLLYELAKSCIWGFLF